ncbi:hypothetical protein [Corynebacterium kalidii]
MRTTRCNLYLPGHTVHYIQGRKLGEFQIEFPERCRKVTLNDLGAGWFEAVLDGETYLGWNHDPDRVTMLARHSVFGEVVYIPFSKSLAGVRRDDYGRRTGSYVLYPAWCGDDEDAERTGFRRCDEK